MITLVASSLLLCAAAHSPDVAIPGVPRPGVAEIGALEPGVATWGVAGTGIAAPRDPFSLAALAPKNVDLFVSITDAAAARRALLQRPAGQAIGRILGDSPVTSVWRTLVERVEVARRTPDHPLEERPLDEEAGSMPAQPAAVVAAPSLVDPAFDRFVDDFFGREATLIARRVDHEVEWAVATRVDREFIEPLLDRLSPRVLGGGWRELVGTEIEYTFRRDLLVFAPLARPTLGEHMVTLIDGGGERLAGTAELAAARALGESCGLGAAAVATVEVFLRQRSLAPAAGRAAADGAKVESPLGAVEIGWAAIAAGLSPSGTITVRHRSSFADPVFPEVPEQSINFAALRRAAGNATVAMVHPFDDDPSGGGGSEAGSFTALSPAVSVVDRAQLGSAPPGGHAAGLVAAGSGHSRSSPLDALAGVMRLPAFVVVAPSDHGATATPRDGAPTSAIVLEIAEGMDAVSRQEADVAARVRGTKLDAAGLVRRGGPGDFPRERSAQHEQRPSSVIRFVRGRAGDFTIVGDDERFVGQLAARLSSAELPSDAGAAPLRVKSMGSMRGADLAHKLLLRIGDDASSMHWLAPLAPTLSRIEWRVIQPDTRTVEVGAEIELAPRSVR